MKTRPNKKAFTLAETLIGVLIVVVLVTMAVPMYQRAVEKSRIAEVSTTLQRIGDSKLRVMESRDITNFDKNFTLAQLDVNVPASNDFSYDLHPTCFPNAVSAKRLRGDHAGTDFLFLGKTATEYCSCPAADEDSVCAAYCSGGKKLFCLGSESDCDAYGMVAYSADSCSGVTKGNDTTPDLGGIIDTTPDIGGGDDDTSGLTHDPEPNPGTDAGLGDKDGGSGTGDGDTIYEKDGDLELADDTSFCKGEQPAASIEPCGPCNKGTKTISYKCVDGQWEAMSTGLCEVGPLWCTPGEVDYEQGNTCTVVGSEGFKSVIKEQAAAQEVAQDFDLDSKAGNNTTYTYLSGAKCTNACVWQVNACPNSGGSSGGGHGGGVGGGGHGGGDAGGGSGGSVGGGGGGLGGGVSCKFSTVAFSSAVLDEAGNPTGDSNTTCVTTVSCDNGDGWESRYDC